MASKHRTARKQLSYPLYGADFDPLNPDFLLVGGGGGSTSSGVPNKITLLDVSRLDTLNIITDVDLAKNEDSVTSLAIAESDADHITAYAGINSSLKDQEAGKNEHFRSFRIGLPAKKRRADLDEKSTASIVSGIPKTLALTRTALFKSAIGPKNDVYQRVLRVAPAHKNGGERLAAIASGLATKNEVLVLRATPTPGMSNVVSRIDVENGEAADLDLIPVEDEAQSSALAYCTDYELYLQHIPSQTGKGLKEPIKVYSTPTEGKRSKIRSLRWLNSRFLLLLRNRPMGGGSDLVILKTDKDYTQTQEVLSKTLAKTTKQAVGLATVALSTSSRGDQQFLVAAAGQDSSIEILSVDLITGSGMTKFTQYAHLREVHSGPITRVTFSNFQSPALPVTKNTKPQYIRLASVGVDLNVVVQTLPLRPYPAVYTKEPRYVLTPPPETFKNAINIFTALLIIGVTALCMQIFCEIRGLIPPTLHAQTWLSPHWQSKLAIPNSRATSTTHFPSQGGPGPVIPASIPPIPTVSSALVDSLSSASSVASDAAASATTYLSDLLSSTSLLPNAQIIMRDTQDPHDTNVDAELHAHDSDAVKDTKVRKWEQLSEKEKKGWKKRLIEAGHWTEKQGETVLKGILFSQIGAAVGAAVAGG